MPDPGDINDPSPPGPPPLPVGYAPIWRDQRKIDADHLRLLSIFHYAAAVMGFLGLAFLPMHYFLMSNMFSHPGMFMPNDPAQMAEVFPLLKWMYLIIGVVVVAAVMLNALSGWCLARRKAQGFSIVIAALNCLLIPFGTVLGVFTLMVLRRDTVREEYAGRSPSG